MPQSNDAELTELFTASTGVNVEDNEPNTGPPACPPANNFDVRLQAVAGSGSTPSSRARASAQAWYWRRARERWPWRP